MGKIAAVWIMAVGATISAAAQSGSIVIYRPGKFTGRLSHPVVFCDGAPAVKMGNARKVTVTALPGRHVCGSEGGNQIPIEVTAGTTAYLRMALYQTWEERLHGLRNATLFLSSRTEAEPAMQKLKPLEPKWILKPELVGRDSLR